MTYGIQDKIKSELLAPAGSFETCRAVINAGADAVYLGGNSFGARAYADNLSEEELLNAIDFVHIHGRKLYLTVNTLLKNTELFGRLYDYILPLYENGLDGVIVQDYGVMKFLHDNFPDMEIHASTQMTITDAHYIDFLRKYGVKRIVPARELSLSEIQKLHEACDDMEIECFVHGALCYCYSGQCLMSSFVGGRSGNRGRCAGTCRLDFSKAGYQNGKETAILSLKDLCTLDILPEILAAGVYSLKIEGRMKSPEYAAGVTSIYRKYIDMLSSGQKYHVEQADKERLLMLFDRGGITDGYYKRHNGRELVAKEHKSDKSLEQKACLEDSIRQKYVLKDIKEKVKLTCRMVTDKPMSLTMECAGHTVTAEGPNVLTAQNRPMTADDIMAQLKKLGNTEFEAEETVAECADNIFVPKASLNALRRDASDMLRTDILSGFRRIAPQKAEYSATESSKRNGDIKIYASVMTSGQAKALIEGGVDRIYAETELMSIEELLELGRLCRSTETEFYIGMPRVVRNDKKSNTDWLNRLLDELKADDFDGFLIRNMAQYYMLKDAFSCRFVADYTMYAFNNLTAGLLEKEGFSQTVYPVELNEKELMHLDIDNGEIIIYGKIPFMVTAGCIDNNTAVCHYPDGAWGSFKDRKNAVIDYLACCRYCYNVIYNSVPLYLIDKADSVKNTGAGAVSLRFSSEDADNAGKILKTAVRTFRDSMPYDSRMMPADFTRGHFTRGVE